MVGASRSERGEEALRRGSQHALDYTEADWPDQVRKLTDGKGADIILDRGVVDQSLAALAPFGRLVVYGTADRERSTLVPQALMAKNQPVTGYHVGQWFAGRPAQSLEAFNSLVTLMPSGKLTVSAADRLPLSGGTRIPIAPWRRDRQPGRSFSIRGNELKKSGRSAS